MTTTLLIEVFLALLAAFILYTVWKKRPESPAELRRRYCAADEFIQLLEKTEATYGVDESDIPIRTKDYLVLLGAFGQLLAFVDNLPEAYDTDFRKNLPAGGWRGLETLPDMNERLQDVREFVARNSVYARTGESLARNLNAVLGLVRPDDKVDVLIEEVTPLLRTIAAGDIRDVVLA